MNIFKNFYRSAATLLAACAFSGNVYADGPEINIGGDVYGGGKNGLVGVDNLAEGVTKDGADTQIKLTDGAVTEISSGIATTNVEINDGNIRTVFGGGKNGRVFGIASVTVNGGEIGGEEWAGTTHGGVFGAGDGAGAVVFGTGRATVKGGKIWNNVYGGGNQAKLVGHSSVTLQGGRIYGEVYGAARMADVLAYSRVNIDGENISGPMYVKGVFGGNDIAGVTADMTTVTENISNWNWLMYLPQFAGKAMKPDPAKPQWLEDEVEVATTPYAPDKHINRAVNVNEIWNNVVTSTARSEEKKDIDLFVGNVFGGGNGAYKYEADGASLKLTMPYHMKLDANGKWVADADYKENADGEHITDPEYTGTLTTSKTFTNLEKPETDRTYLQLEGGTFGYVYGGGNEVTVNRSADIYINNPEDPCVIPVDEVRHMGLQSTSYTLVKNIGTGGTVEWADSVVVGDVKQPIALADRTHALFAQTIDRVFGGNNVAPMHIRPNWYLIQGRINNLYSGGNKGSMTNANGILVNVFSNAGEFDKDPVTNAKYPVNAVKINNIYGGCRMADVTPAGDGGSWIKGTTAEDKAARTMFGYEFLPNYATRVYISGGRINNVYGGNDVSGRVKYGTDVEIHGAISGDVYGGGNGAYRYTDNKALAQAYPDEWSDYFYDADGKGAVFDDNGNITNTEAGSATASLAGLNLKRPHVASTLVHIAGSGTWINKDKAAFKDMIDWKEAPTQSDLSDVKSAVKVAFDKVGGKWKEIGGEEAGLVLTRGEMIDDNRVYVTGGVYCGGNSAAVTSEVAETGQIPRATLQLGQCVTIDQVFLGSNGARMVEEGLLSDYARGIVYDEGALTYRRANATGETGTVYRLAKYDLTLKDHFDEYMHGVDMDIMPALTYDNPDRVFTGNAGDETYYGNFSDDKGVYVTADKVGQEIDVSVDEDADMDEQGLNFSTRIGSFFVGGNVGSVTVEGTIGEANGLKFPRELVIFDKVVGGCNAANVPYRKGINAFHLGGVTGEPTHVASLASLYQEKKVATPLSAEGENDPGLKIQLYVPCRMEPRVLNKAIDADGYVYVRTKDDEGNAVEPEPWSAPTVISDYGIESDKTGTAQILDRGNIYGGCYTSGIVNGSIQIDIKDELCATPQMRAYFGDRPLLGQQAGQDGTAAVVDNMRRYVLNHGWSAFGGGYGKDTEVWGNVYMNMSRNAGYINAYGGSQLGFIGKMQRHTAEGHQDVVKRTYNTETQRYDYTTESVPVAPGDYVSEPTTTTTTTTTTSVTNFTVDSIDVKIDKYLVDATGGIKGGSTYMNLRADIHRSPVSIFGLNALYGGGYQGIVTGNTHMYAGGGLHYDVFGGASNADIYGYAETFVGIDREGKFTNNLQLRHCVYGGNDFGGQILGQGTHKVVVNGVEKELTSNTYVKYLGGTIERSIFGGSCGLYDYDGTYTWTAEDEAKTPGTILLGEVEYDPAPGDFIPLYPHNLDQYDWEDFKTTYPAIYAVKDLVKESWETMPTLFNNLRYSGDPATLTNPNSYNTVVDIACTADLKTDMTRGIMGNTILGNIYGGGYGFCDAIGRVDAHDSYVVLAGPENGTNRLADNVFGGGYFSYVQNSTLEAVSGRVRNLYGGTYGTTVDAAVAYILREDKREKAKTQTSTWGSEFDQEEYSVLSEFSKTQLVNADYTSQTTLVNVYPTMTANSAVNVYGAGAYTGSDFTKVNMLGGNVNEVYGGSNQEGVCKSTVVNVPDTSRVSMAALFGGSHGSYKALPCDVHDATINFNSSLATVRDGNIYGGNNAYRATRNTIINFNSQAKNKNDATGRYLTIYGAGNGEFTVSGNTQVNISGNSIVQDLFGGGRDGSVFAKYDIVKDLGEPSSAYLILPEDTRTKETSHEDSVAYKNAFDAATSYHDASGYKRFMIHTDTHDATTYAHWYETTLPHHTWVNLSEGAQVMGSVCGAGYGYRSVVAGNTLVDCNGAIILGDIFGGGYNGNVRKMVAHDTGYKLHDYEGFKDQVVTEFVQDTGDTGDTLYYENADAQDAYTVSTTINMNGGTVRNIFGGGYAGVVGGVFENSADTVKCVTVGTGAYDMTATTNVNVGSEHGKLVADSAGKQPGEDGYVTTYASALDHAYGIPNVNFSVYGAGDRGAVYGEAITKMYNGYIGYDYRPYTADELSAMTDDQKNEISETASYYIPRLKSNADDKSNLMKEDGNLYGGGFGEDARVLQTDVTLYDGVIRNSLYGGGEMSAVGWGTVTLNTTTNELELSEIQKSGSTFVEMYGGLVHADAFAGGRGYSYDNFGKMMFGTKYNTDGFVFGKTDINIYRGIIGDDETIKEANGAHGNVFGGGNLGYVYSGSGKPSSDDGYYYKVSDVNATTPSFVMTDGNKTLTEDARVNIQVYGKATADVTIPYSIDYHPGFTVPTEIYDRMFRHLGTIEVGTTTYDLADMEQSALQALHDELIDDESRALQDFTFNDNGTFLAGDYIPNEALGSLENVYADATTDPWQKIDQSGITIRNAVFAGGNVSKGSDKVYAFANTVFGNATASIIDTYSRDLIDVGGDGIGGLYGDGNLTFVDGYRELNVTNYGTDYYALSGQLDFSDDADVARYNMLTKRQQDFYTTKFTCIADPDGTGGYAVNDVITNEDLRNLAEEKEWPEHWDEKVWNASGTAGTTNYYWEQYFQRTAAIINEGRYLNTIQRADYCGLKGSRLVMKGAMDRALDEGEAIDYTPYTINRVGELSLNQNNIGDERHGSYAGFYNVVKYLGSMSSDKNFVTGLVDASAGIAQSSIRETDSQSSLDIKAVPGITITYSEDGKTGTVTTSGTKKVYIPEGDTRYSLPEVPDNATADASQAQTFFEWKIANYDKSNRNNGASPNKIALASGVFLELVKGLNEDGTKDYGPIIGVVELDLLNVSPGEGGGFVYAKNHHGLPHFDTSKSYASVLSDANYHLKTVRAYSYDDLGTEYADEPDAFNGVETSGNFVHSSKHILDDCFPTSNDHTSAAHYWYIRGDFYVYDQLISAYTGNAATYRSELKLPLDLNGKQGAQIRLLNVLPGLYADPDDVKYISEESSDSLGIIFSNQTKMFGHNDPVSYWDWHNMSVKDREKFVLNTYTCTDSVQYKVNETDTEFKVFYPGQAILPSEYAALSGKTAYDMDGNQLIDTGEQPLNLQEMFRITNEISDDKGYLLTLDLTNPDSWNNYYTLNTDKDTKLTTSAFNALSESEKANYVKGASFTCLTSGVYGQYVFVEGDVTSKSIYDLEAGLSEEAKNYRKGNLATFEPAYIVADSCEITINGETSTYLAGYPMPLSEVKTITNISGKAGNVTHVKDADDISSLNRYIQPAYICVSTVEVKEKEYRYLNQLVSKAEYDDSYKDKKYPDTETGKQLGDKFEPAYYCTGGQADNSKGGSWGGTYFEKDHVYQGEDVCNVIHDDVNPDRDEYKFFTFNYDALDLLVSNYEPYNVWDGNGVEADARDEADVLDLMARAETNLNGEVKYYDGLEGVEQEIYQKILTLDGTATYKGSSSFVYKDASDASLGTGGQKTITTDATLTTRQYDNLPNDRKYYVPFSKSEGETIKYVVQTAFDVAGKVYNAGQTISAEEFDRLTEANQSYIDKVDVSSYVNGNKYYYCVQSYKIGAQDGYVSKKGSTEAFVSSSVTTVGGTEYSNGSVVPLGAIIREESFEGNVPNYQIPADFTLTGVSPTEEATLYVPVTADMDALMKDRYVTAIYEYRYSETNDGINYETLVEKHIINIRLKFMYGQPKIGPITPPELILPLENIAMSVPALEEGAFPIIGAGWEIFPTLSDAQRHRNGAAYDNGRQPLYWYQNGYYIAYYAATKQGRTYSAPEQINVANYQKLTDVINDANHMFIDHKDCDRNPKIYINDGLFNQKAQAGTPVTAAENINQLDALKTLFDLTNTDYGIPDGKLTTGSGTESDPTKTVLQNHGRALTNCQNLDFIISNDIDQRDYQYKETEGEGDDAHEVTKTKANTWTSIGDAAHCFSGTIHGNGHAISGLENSLFGYLCGDVYNLGVMGSFTGSGIADHGSGRAENCWIWTTAKPAEPATDLGVKAVMGDDGADPNPATVVNCYYPETDKYVAGTAKARTVEDFLNGQVAYDLNRFYLEARYRRGADPASPTVGTVANKYIYRKLNGDIDGATGIGADASFVPTQYTVKYDSDTDDARFRSYFHKTKVGDEEVGHPLGYVEHLYEDGDFRFAGKDQISGNPIGVKPTSRDMRMVGDNDWLPIYPDDYIFFGQKLTYKLYEQEHDFYPAAAVKDISVKSSAGVDNSSNGLLSMDNTTTNRLYRAPAYFRDGVYGKSVIFNSEAAFRDNIKVGGPKTGTGGSTGVEAEYDDDVMPYDGYMPTKSYLPHHYMTAVDFTGGNGDLAGGYKSETDAHPYAPLLDFNSLSDIKVEGLTQNLLVYIPANDLTTGGTVDATGVNSKTATVVNNYFKDVAYAETDSKYRTVDVASTENIHGHVVQKVNGDGYMAYVDHLLVDKQDFNAPIAYTFDNANYKRMWYQRDPTNFAVGNIGWSGVSIPFKAELVTTQDKGEITHFYQGSAVGHEYWLRQYDGKAETSADPEVYAANFKAPAPISGNNTVENTFLWDYYYYNGDMLQKDENKDKYQEYYSKTRTYSDYPYVQAGTPYLVGFPGSMYYEFDLSGTFVPQWTDKPIAKLDKQIITFASAEGETINVSDDEISSGKVAEDGYTFTPTYLNNEDAVSTNLYYTMAGNGGRYVNVANDAFASQAFRPYFTKAASSGAKQITRSIIFGSDDKNSMFDVEERNANNADGNLTVKVRKLNLILQSSKNEATPVVVSSVNGTVIATFSIEPGETRIVPINAPGIYLVNNKKFTVNN